MKVTPPNGKRDIPGYAIPYRVTNDIPVVSNRGKSAAMCRFGATRAQEKYVLLKSMVTGKILLISSVSASIP